jgi:hypothetical protein
MAEYRTLPNELAPEVVRTITDWLGRCLVGEK